MAAALPADADVDAALLLRIKFNFKWGEDAAVTSALRELDWTYEKHEEVVSSWSDWADHPARDREVAATNAARKSVRGVIGIVKRPYGISETNVLAGLHEEAMELYSNPSAYPAEWSISEARQPRHGGHGAHRTLASARRGLQYMDKDPARRVGRVQGAPTYGAGPQGSLAQHHA